MKLKQSDLKDEGKSPSEKQRKARIRHTRTQETFVCVNTPQNR